MASVIGVGDDDSMRDIAAVLAGTDVPPGIVPAGTGLRQVLIPAG